MIAFRISDKAQRRIAFGVALIVALLLIAEEHLFPLATYHPGSVATLTFQWKMLKKDAEDLAIAWAKGRADLLEQAQRSIPKETAAREVLRLSTIELQYLDFVNSAIPMFGEMADDYKQVLAIGGEPYERFKSNMADYRTISEVYPKIVQCRQEVGSDSQKLIAGLQDMGSSEKAVDALISMTNGLASLVRSTRTGQFAHCGNELVRFEEAYGRLVAQHSDVVDVLKEHAEEQACYKKIFHWFLVAVLLFLPWLPENARKLKEVFS